MYYAKNKEQTAMFKQDEKRRAEKKSMTVRDVNLFAEELLKDQSKKLRKDVKEYFENWEHKMAEKQYQAFKLVMRELNKGATGRPWYN